MRTGMRDPIVFDVPDEPHHDRVQVLLRVLVMIFLGAIGAPIGGIFWVLYLGLPIVAAVLVGSRGADWYRTEAGNHGVAWLRWFLGVCAYLGLLRDRLPVSLAEPGVRLDVTPDGTPTVGGALVRLITSIPAAIVLWLLAIIGVVVWIIGAVGILATRGLPGFVARYQRGALRMLARYFVHHASLATGMAPIAFDTGHEPLEAPDALAPAR